MRILLRSRQALSKYLIPVSMRTEANTRDCHKMETFNWNLIPFYSFHFLPCFYLRIFICLAVQCTAPPDQLGLMMRGNLIYFDGCQQLVTRTPAPPPPAPSWAAAWAGPARGCPGTCRGSSSRQTRGDRGGPPGPSLAWTLSWPHGGTWGRASQNHPRRRVNRMWAWTLLDSRKREISATS